MPISSVQSLIKKWNTRGSVEAKPWQVDQQSIQPQLLQKLFRMQEEPHKYPAELKD